MGFRWGKTWVKCRIAINIDPFWFPWSSPESELSLLKVSFSESLLQATVHCFGQASLQMANLDISLCVWIWRWSISCLSNKSVSRMSEFCYLQTMETSNGIWREMFTRPVRTLTHITQEIWGAQLLSSSLTLHPKESSQHFLKSGLKFRLGDLKVNQPHT